MHEEMIGRLTTWSFEERINPRDFCCKYYEKCNSRPEMPLSLGDTVVMSYYGKDFGEPFEPCLLRLMIVGMDHGNSCHGLDFEDRRKMIEEWERPDLRKNFKVESPHYAGVVHTAAAFLGEFGVHCEAKCQERCSRSTGKSVDTCVLDRVAQPNLVKCVSRAAEDMTCKASGTMRENCSFHLFDEIRICKPHVVVVHGRKEQGAIFGHFASQAIKFFDLQEVSGLPNANVLCHVPLLECYFVFLPHPAYGHMERHWETLAVPSLRYLKKINIIK